MQPWQWHRKIDGIESYTYELFDVLEVKRERPYVFDAISELNNIENVKIEIDPRWSWSNEYGRSHSKSN